MSAPASTPAPRAAFRRGPGLWVLAALVTAGMGLPAFLQWKVPQLEAERDRILREAPTEPEGKLARWFDFGQPQLHHALRTARFSAAQPWYVSHVVDVDEGEPEVWGIDLSFLDDPELDHDSVFRLEGLTVRIVLEAPRLLARTELAGTRTQGVPRFAAGQELDAADLTRRRLETYFESFSAALARDVPGSRLVVQVGDAGTEEGE